MKKQIKIAALTSVAVLSLAGIAGATQLNMYGASAQFNFWGAAAPGWMNSLGCKTAATGGVALTTANINTAFSKHYYLKGFNCNLTPFGGAASDTLEFSWSGVASVEGIAVNSGATQYNDNAPAPGFTNTCAGGNKYRWMNQAGVMQCKEVHIGSLDLDATSIHQISDGQLYGPLGGGHVHYDWSATGGLPMTGATKVPTQLLVPFTAIVNTGVQANICTAGDPAHIGDVCNTPGADVADCGTAGVCTANTTINNLSREQMAVLFSGQVVSMGDFGPQYNAVQPTICLRHAGSGTAGAFDMMVVSGASVWGNSVVQLENVDTTGSSTNIYFVDSTDTMVQCVNGHTAQNQTLGTSAAIIGYCDADKGLTGLKNLAGLTYDATFTHKIKYNGAWASAANINNGVYDWYAQSHMYIDNVTANAVQHAMANHATLGLAAYTSNVANIPSSKAAFYTTKTAATFVRADDKSYP